MHKKCVYVSASFGGRFVDKKGRGQIGDKKVGGWSVAGAGGAWQAKEEQKYLKYTKEVFFLLHYSLFIHFFKIIDLKKMFQLKLFDLAIEFIL